MKNRALSKAFSPKTVPTHGAAISDRRWTKYVLGSVATALAGAGGTVTPVEAEIHYSGLVKVIVDATQTRSTQEAFLPMSEGASLSFDHGRASNGRGAAFVGLRGAATQSIRGTGNAFFGQASKLYSGDTVSAGPFIGGSAVDLFLIFQADRQNPWARRGRGFVGFRFNAGNGVQYGWARLQMKGAPDNAFKVVDYAWADPGEGIIAGQMRSDPSQAGAVPQSGSLAFLALGAVGLKLWRSRRAEGFTR